MRPALRVDAQAVPALMSVGSSSLIAVARRHRSPGEDLRAIGTERRGLNLDRFAFTVPEMPSPKECRLDGIRRILLGLDLAESSGLTVRSGDADRWQC